MQQLLQWIEIAIHHPLLQWNNGVLRNRDRLRTYLPAAGSDIAIPNAMLLAQVRHPVLHVQRMHLKRGRVDQKTRPDKLVKLLVLAQNVTDVLAQKTLNALAEFLHPVDVALLHAPSPIRRIRSARLKFLDGFLDLE